MKMYKKAVLLSVLMGLSIPQVSASHLVKNTLINAANRATQFMFSRNGALTLSGVGALASLGMYTYCFIKPARHLYLLHNQLFKNNSVGKYLVDRKNNIGAITIDEVADRMSGRDHQKLLQMINGELRQIGNMRTYLKGFEYKANLFITKVRLFESPWHQVMRQVDELDQRMECEGLDIQEYLSQLQGFAKDKRYVNHLNNFKTFVELMEMRLYLKQLKHNITEQQVVARRGLLQDDRSNRSRYSHRPAKKWGELKDTETERDPQEAEEATERVCKDLERYARPAQQDN